ncbi:MAG: hypothetical protein CXZ00_15760 [Acidobacteria bacterium]|nr:MAG: hypothetical protein CXZ00_15760 [Acidobacteriota bacterium]
MNEYKTEDEALAEAGESYFLEQTLSFILAGKNISSKDLATALRCDHVTIPKEILHYAADRLDGTPKRRGKPVDVMLTSAREAFSNRDFEAEEIQAKFYAMKKDGLTNEEIFDLIGREYHKSSDWVSAKVYPRGEK